MTDHASKTGRLVVRYHAPVRRRAWVVFAVIGGMLALYSMYEWGRFDGGYSVLVAAQERRELQSQVDALRHDTTTLRANIVGAETARQVENKSYDDVERSLTALQEQVQRQNEELAFYRGIVAPEDGVGGLRVQRVEILNGAVTGHYILRLVLMQSMRQEKTVSGGVRIEIAGSKEEQPVRLTLGDLGANSRDGELIFSFRYFQKLETEVTLPVGFQPTTVELAVRASQQSPQQQTFPWQVINSG